MSSATKSAAQSETRSKPFCGVNREINPNNGTLAGTDTTLAYATGDANAAANPNLVAVAYTNSVAGTPSTTLYGIDSNLDILVRQGSPGGAPVSPNSGQLFTVGPLGVNTANDAGFDISDCSGNGYHRYAKTFDEHLANSCP